MPKRSNQFQRLTALIHERLGHGWMIEDSHMFIDLITGELREVDIVAQSTFASHLVCISIECRDQARPADVLWVEGMSKKHEHLPTSKLVLWSRSGFSKTAIVKAKALKIDTVSQADAAQIDWARLARDLVGGRVQHVTPSFTTFIDIDSPDGVSRRLDEVANSSCYKSDGALAGTVQTLIQHIAMNPEIRTMVLDSTNTGKDSFYVELKPTEPWFTDTPEGGRAKIQRIGVDIETFTENALLSTASALVEGKVITLTSAALVAGTLELVVEESLDGNTTFQSKFMPKNK